MKTLSRNKILTSIKGHDIVTNKQKITGNSSNLDLVNMNAYIKFGEFLSICTQDIEHKQNFCYIKGHNSGTNLRKITCNNPKLDLVNMNAYIKFGEILSIGSQDIEGKQNFGVNKGPEL